MWTKIQKLELWLQLLELGFKVGLGSGAGGRCMRQFREVGRCRKMLTDCILWICSAVQLQVSLSSKLTYFLRGRMAEIRGGGGGPG